MYCRSICNKSKISKAIKYLTLAANQSHIRAQYQLGMIYFNGFYTKQDIQKAIKYLTLAADRNHIESQHQLGMIYNEKSIDISFLYFTKAKKRGHHSAQRGGLVKYEKSKANHNNHYNHFEKVTTLDEMVNLCYDPMLSLADILI